MPSSAEGRRAWGALAALLACGAAAGFFLLPGANLDLDWQPSRALSEPWRAFSATFVQYSQLHLAANLAGAALVGALGVAARVPVRSAVAWLAAWPLTQLGLLAKPELLHYGGLSGVLHAGAACVAWHLIAGTRGARRFIGALLLLALALKVASEAPWGPALRHPAGWDIATAPAAHASGLLAGLLAAAFADAIYALRRNPGARARSASSL